MFWLEDGQESVCAMTLLVGATPEGTGQTSRASRASTGKEPGSLHSRLSGPGQAARGLEDPPEAASLWPALVPLTQVQLMRWLLVSHSSYSWSRGCWELCDQTYFRRLTLAVALSRGGRGMPWRPSGGCSVTPTKDQEAGLMGTRGEREDRNLRGGPFFPGTRFSTQDLADD